MGQALRARRAAYAVISASLLLAASVGAAAAQPPAESDWMPDTLLAGFEAKTFTFENDYDGPVTATLVRRPHATRQACAVLYVHGYVDYFFQPWLADFFETGLQDGGAGCDFFALDLRSTAVLFRRTTSDRTSPRNSRSTSRRSPRRST